MIWSFDSGTLTAIHTEEQYEYYQDDVVSQRNNGYEIELLSAREARAIEPEANGELPGYLYRSQRGQADPVKSTRAFAHAADMAGAFINTGQNVISIIPMSTSGYSIQTQTAEFRCQTLVLATGAWCDPVGKMLGIKFLLFLSAGKCGLQKVCRLEYFIPLALQFPATHGL